MGGATFYGMQGRVSSSSSSRLLRRFRWAASASINKYNTKFCITFVMAEKLAFIHPDLGIGGAEQLVVNLCLAAKQHGY